VGPCGSKMTYGDISVAMRGTRAQFTAPCDLAIVRPTADASTSDGYRGRWKMQEHVCCIKQDSKNAKVGQSMYTVIRKKVAAHL